MVKITSNKRLSSNQGSSGSAIVAFAVLAGAVLLVPAVLSFPPSFSPWG